MNTKTLTHNNPISLFHELVESIKEGYRIVGNKSFLTTYPYFEIDLYYNEGEVTVLTDEEVLATIQIVEYDKLKFLLAIQQHVVSGWEVDLKTLSFSEIGSKFVTMNKPSHEGNKQYTREEMEEMEYETLKRAAKLRGCFNKSRNQMINNILRYQAQ